MSSKLNSSFISGHTNEKRCLKFGKLKKTYNMYFYNEVTNKTTNIGKIYGKENKY